MSLLSSLVRCVACLVLFISSAASDPCGEAQAEVDTIRAVTSIDAGLCDKGHFRSDTWYYFELSGKPAVIPTECVKNGQCGTQVGLRINLHKQKLPTVANKTVVAVLCGAYDVLGMFDCCVLGTQVLIRWCEEQDRLIYRFPKADGIDRCDMAVCTIEANAPLAADLKARHGELVRSTSSASTGPPTMSATQESDTVTEEAREDDIVLEDEPQSILAGKDDDADPTASTTKGSDTADTDSGDKQNGEGDSQLSTSPATEATSFTAPLADDEAAGVTSLIPSAASATSTPPDVHTWSLGAATASVTFTLSQTPVNDSTPGDASVVSGGDDVTTATTNTVAPVPAAQSGEPDAVTDVTVAVTDSTSPADDNAVSTDVSDTTEPASVTDPVTQSTHVTAETSSTGPDTASTSGSSNASSALVSSSQTTAGTDTTPTSPAGLSTEHASNPTLPSSPEPGSTQSNPSASVSASEPTAPSTSSASPSAPSASETTLVSEENTSPSPSVTDTTAAADASTVTTATTLTLPASTTTTSTTTATSSASPSSSTNTDTTLATAAISLGGQTSAQLPMSTTSSSSLSSQGPPSSQNTSVSPLSTSHTASEASTPDHTREVDNTEQPDFSFNEDLIMEEKVRLAFEGNYEKDPLFAGQVEGTLQRFLLGATRLQKSAAGTDWWFQLEIITQPQAYGNLSTYMDFRVKQSSGKEILEKFEHFQLKEYYRKEQNLSLYAECRPSQACEAWSPVLHQDDDAHFWDRHASLFITVLVLSGAVLLAMGVALLSGSCRDRYFRRGTYNAARDDYEIKDTKPLTDQTNMRPVSEVSGQSSPFSDTQITSNETQHQAPHPANNHTGQEVVSYSGSDVGGEAADSNTWVIPMEDAPGYHGNGNPPPPVQTSVASPTISPTTTLQGRNDMFVSTRF